MTFSSRLISTTGALLVAGTAVAAPATPDAAAGLQAAGETYMTHGGGYVHEVRARAPQPFRFVAPPTPEPVFDARHTGEAYATAGDRRAPAVDEPEPRSAFARLRSEGRGQG